MAQRNWVRCCIPILLALGIAWIINTWVGQSYFTLAPLFAVLAMGIYHGGALPASMIALLIIGYSFYASPDMIRAFIISVSTLFIVGPIVILRRAADNANTILKQLRDLDIFMTGLETKWPTMNEAERKRSIIQARYKITHILTLALGWHELAAEKEAVLDEYESKT